MTTETPLAKITSYATADEFYYWLAEHPEITDLQGWTIHRFEAPDNRPSYFTGCELRFWIDIDFIYGHRYILNDWIDRYLTDPTLADHYTLKGN